MWLVQHLNPGLTAYNMTVGLRLDGPLDRALFGRAIDVVLQRHEAFRTSFDVVDGEPVQRIAEPLPLKIDFQDLRDLSPPQREARARRTRDKMVAEAFDLSRPGLYRICLLQMDAQQHVLFWVIHHAIGDHWSNGILVREIGHVYSQILLGRSPALPVLPLAYADFAAWQRDTAQDAALAPQMAYWHERLQGIQPLALPYDIPTRELPSGRAAASRRSLARQPSRALQRLSTRHGATSFMTLLACFKMLLSRYCGQDDIAVGSPVANRTRVEFESLVGTLVNTLVLRTRVSGETRFTALLEHIKESTIDAFANQDAPFERLVEELDVDRSAVRSPLVQALFNVVNSPRDLSGWVGMSLTPFSYESTAAQFDLSITVEPRPSGEVHLAYSTDVFVKASAERLLHSYIGLIEQVIADPTGAVRDYNVLGEEHAATLARWNATTVRVMRAGTRRSVHRRQHGSARLEDRAAQRIRLPELRRIAPAAASAWPATCVRAAFRAAPWWGCASSVRWTWWWRNWRSCSAGAAYVPLDPAYPRRAPRR